MQEQKNKKINQSRKYYQSVLDAPLVPMAVRIGVYDSVHTDSSLEASKLILDDLLVDIASGLGRLAQSSVAKTIYATKNPVIRIVSNFQTEVKVIENICLQSLLVQSRVDKSKPVGEQKESSEGDITFSKDVISLESDQDFLLKQTCLQSDLLVIFDNDLFLQDDRETENLSHTINAAFSANSSLSILLIDNDGVSIFLRNEQHENRQVLDKQMLVKQLLESQRLDKKQRLEKLTIELNEILLFDSLLQQHGQHTDVPLQHSALQRITDYKNESSLIIQDVEADFEYQGPLGSKASWASWHNLFRRFVSLFSTNKSHQNKSLECKSNSTDKNTGIEKQKNNASLKKLAGSMSCHLLFAQFLRADQLAVRYANAHRSSFILIYCLGAFALINAAIAIGFSDIGWLALTSALAEFFALVGIFLLYRNDHKKRYHIKWLEYRSLAEMLRMTPLLNSLGVAPSVGGFERHRYGHESEVRTAHSAGRIWLIIYTESLKRWISFDKVKIHQESLSSIRSFLKRTVLENQIEYHKNNAHKMHVVGHNLGHFSFILFVLAFVFVSAKLMTKFLAAMHVGISYEVLSHLGHNLGVLAAICPMIGSAAFAIRNHAEFDISSQRSVAMKKNLQKDIDSLKLIKQPICYSELIEQTLQTSSVMQSETADWLEIYEVKETEPG